MSIENLQDQSQTTTGWILRRARENMGLSQEVVAEKLCLRVSTVRDIENDHANFNLAPTFLLGYIRSYAHLVRMSEDELALIIAKQALISVSSASPIQSFSLYKTRRKRDVWLMRLTWLIMSIVIGLTGIWWWQNHQAQQQDITNMVDRCPTKLSPGYDTTTSFQFDDDIDASIPPIKAPAIVNSSVLHSADASITYGEPDIGVDYTNSNILVINFINECWLEVFDANNKKLFGGIRYSGANLYLTGRAPYKLKIGAPAAVQIQYQGKLVDLGRFIRTNQIARLTLANQ